MGAPGVKAGEFDPPCSESVPTIQWMDCLENFGQKNYIFTLAIFVHFHNYRSTKHFLIDFLQYQKKKSRGKSSSKASVIPQFRPAIPILWPFVAVWCWCKRCDFLWKKKDFVPYKDGITGTCQRPNYWVPLASSCTHVMYLEIWPGVCGPGAPFPLTWVSIVNYLARG